MILNQNNLSSESHPSTKTVFDFIGIGFGPSNLALAVAAEEIDPSKKGIFFELKNSFDWHAGMMLDGSRMQISFLKDLVTLRNPASRFTFLQYTKARGRLERFVNLGEFHPTRLEYQDYLKWVAEVFSHQVFYGRGVRRVTLAPLSGDVRRSVFRVEVEDVKTREQHIYLAYNLVCASGGKPRIPRMLASVAAPILHSCEFLQRFPQLFTDHQKAHEFVVVGDGQSAGEIVAEMLQAYPSARVHLFISGYAPRPADRSPFVNEVFFSEEVDAFYKGSETRRAAVQRELRNTNYGVIDPDLINKIYQRAYLDEVKGERRLFVHPFSRFASAVNNDNAIIVTIEDRFRGPTQVVKCDALVLATGYERSLDPAIFSDLMPFIEKTESGEISLTRNYRVRTTDELDCGLYLQGYGESSHGLGDTLLSLLPFRSKEIFDDICKHTATSRQQPTSCPAHVDEWSATADYPPARHIENDQEKLYAVMERFPFATLISVDSEKRPVVTHVPLILDRSQGKKGVLFGHMDRANPHTDILECSSTLAIFHGPNAYISPRVYETNQLPTWNSIGVHVWVKPRLLTDCEALKRGLMSICERVDQEPGAYRLDPNDQRIPKLLSYIVGFELEIEELVGRFKLSQDRTNPDRLRAARALAQKAEPQLQPFIDKIVG